MTDKPSSVGADFELRIDGFMLSELPLNRAADYIRMLSQVLGVPKETRLVSLVNGSLSASVKIDPAAKAKAFERLLMASQGGNNAAKRSADKLNEAIARDGGRGEIVDLRKREVLLSLPGGKVSVPSTPSFFEEITIKGYLSELGEKIDGRFRGQIRDAKRTYTFTYDEATAHSLRTVLWNYVEAVGKASWLRAPDGKWRITSLHVISVRELQRSSLTKVRELIQDAGGLGLDTEEALGALKGIR